MTALSLFSGGLDSMIATKMMTDMGIKVIAIHINIGFGGRKDVRDIMATRAAIAGATFESIDVREEYIQKILFNPVHGYGKNFNPCIDCHGYMFRIAKEMMAKYGASFIVTGEVLGQRPMSQRSDAMKMVSKLANDSDEKLIVRPMSAKLMEATTPELNGWIDREKLYDISGRSRDRQLSIAKEFGWEDFESPGGGCLLTDINYSQRIREHIAHEDSFSVSDADLLKFGRHFRLPNGAKLIVGREESDNESLKAVNSDKFTTVVIPVIGPFVLLSKDASQSDKELACKIAITYGRNTKGEEYQLTINDEVFTATAFENKTDTHKYLA
jgi:tRNA-specific 2-thiouridylase